MLKIKDKRNIEMERNNFIKELLNNPEDKHF